MWCITACASTVLFFFCRAFTVPCVRTTENNHARVPPSVSRFVNPSNRGSLAVSMLLLYVLMGVPAGYSSSVLYKSFKGRQWQQCTLLTALLFPSMCFTVFLSLNLMSQRYHSTQVNGRVL